jgi:hypothetical protein
MGWDEMLTGQYRRIFHYHLKKCGGSTFNHWLDTLTSDERTWDAMAQKGFSVIDVKRDDAGRPHEMIIPSLAKAVFHWSDVIHNHGPLRMYAPEDTFCLTILRDPVQRLVSQVLDFRRLRGSDTSGTTLAVRACVEDSQRLSLRDFLEKHGQQAGRSNLDNYLTRALAEGRVGNSLDDVVDADRLCEVALIGLEKDYHLVGLTEHLDLSRNALCSMVGLPPAGQFPTINVSPGAADVDPELCAARDIIKTLTCVDRVIYDRARQLFDQRHRKVAENYETNDFEACHAARLLAEARGSLWEGATRYSVRAPIVGSGNHGRDGSGMTSCAVWTGPETRMTLYMPTPSNMPLSLLVWIRGYVNARQRDQLRVRVDGRLVPHCFGVADGYADVLTVDSYSTRDFIRLDIDLDETLESGDPGTELYDERERGFAFDSYGWRPI